MAEYTGPPRRPAHTGSITHVGTVKGQDKYRIRVSSGNDETGRRIQRSRTVVGTRADAERALSELQLDFGSNQVDPITGSIEIGELFQRWQHAHRETWTPSSAETHRNLCANHLARLAHDRVDDLTPKDVRRFYDSLSTAYGLAPGSVRRIHSVLRSAMAWGVSGGLCRTNPAAGVRRVAKKGKDQPLPSMAGVNAMIDAADDWSAAFLKFARTTGARRGELAALRWSDIEPASDPAYSRVLFERRISSGETVEGLKATDRKSLLVSTALVDELGSVARCDVWVFGNDGEHVHPNSLSRVYKQQLKKVVKSHPEMDGTTLHGLRHLCGSYMLERGTPITVVAKHLGHSNPATTMRIYAHSLRQDDPTAADLFGAT